ncbi:MULTISPECIES: Ger(x)C family spore germination protein [unclassified Cytobacillus]|uniref:Ger(x)C family spore germination protein n=1 Tax=unclassified Cytobacillus TaxID=2675268 RepID=UPI002040110D|nr:Ger(x)C family spore germination protein [Cytobacillus sp. AMY 15.2]MCM3093010.1 Ger(x)C family spore germination protein [Cytobacillus sp. AMY 15.2]
MTNNTFIKMGIVALILILTGCVPHNIINEVSLMHNVGYDKEDEMLKASVVYPNYAESDNPALITAAAKNPSSLQEELSHKSQFPFEIGQVRVMIFGDQLSRDGLASILDPICKDPKIGIVRIVITDGTPDLILSKTLNESPLFLMDLIDKSIENEGIPESNSHVMYDQFFGSGIDMSFPNLTVDSKGKIKVDGMGIFKGEKLAFRISEKETFLLKLMTDKNKRGVYSFDLKMHGHKANIGVRTNYGKHKVKFIKENFGEQVRISLNLDVELDALPEWINLEDEKDLKLFKNAVQKSISNDAEILLRDFQTNGVDPLGLGRVYIAHHRNYSEQSFYDRIYPNMKYEVITKITVRQTGVGN